jgi:hypothetical protein
MLLSKLIRSSAQWVNKPKLHHIKHLPESIERLGNATLFSTEKFESYNGFLRQGAIHSNRQAPGCNLAITFDNYSNLKYVLSGGLIYDEKTKKWEKVSNAVTNLFEKNAYLQLSLGYNTAEIFPLPATAFPQNLGLKIPEREIVSPPEPTNPSGKLVSLCDAKG